MDPTSHTCPITTEQASRLRILLEGRGYEFSERPHAEFSAKQKGVSVTVYTKGPKVLIQGRGTGDFIRFLLEPEILGEARLDYDEVIHPEHYSPHFGIDESGKGDYFGPLVIAGAYVNPAVAKRLRDIGATDSKNHQRRTHPQTG